MNTTSKKETQRLIEKYFFGQNNDEIVIKKDDMGKFLGEFSELVISRTLDIAFNMKD
jgi:phage anti-repressor protein